MKHIHSFLAPAALALLLAACGGGNDPTPVVAADPLAELPASASQMPPAVGRCWLQPGQHSVWQYCPRESSPRCSPAARSRHIRWQRGTSHRGGGCTGCRASRFSR